MKRILALLLLSPMLAWGQSYPSPSLQSVSGVTFYAQYTGSCIWNLAGDVGPCINAAIAKAAAAGGGTVVIPGGNYGLATQITQNNSRVHLQGAGSGTPQDNQSGTYIGGTVLTWTGAAAGTMLFVGPSTNNSSTVGLYDADVMGLALNCASLANICVKVANTSNSKFDLLGIDARSINIYITTLSAVTDQCGTCFNDWWLYSRSTSATYSPTGIMIDGGTPVGPDVSFNRIWIAQYLYKNGDGVVEGYSSNNWIYYNDPITLNGTGNAFVFSNSLYTSPNGVQVNGSLPAADTIVINEGPVIVAGFQNGSSIVANGGNSCNGGGSSACGPKTVAVTTSGSTGPLAAQITFASLSGVVAGEVVNCTGGLASGVYPNTPISVVVGAIAQINAKGQYTSTAGTVANATSCTVSYGVQNTGAGGTYTITSTGIGGPFNITAPSGGHSQTGVAVSGSTLSFTDVVIPWTGTASNGDTWTLTVPVPSGITQGIQIVSSDSPNSVADPLFETGTVGTFGRSNNQQLPLRAAPPSLLGLSWGQGTATNGSVVLCATGCTAIGPNDFIGNGNGNTASSYYESVFGNGNTSSGVVGFVAGAQGTDRGRVDQFVYGGYNISQQGDDQHVLQILHNTTSAASSVRLYADATGSAYGANCYNLTANYMTAGFFIDVIVRTRGSTGIYSYWPQFSGVINRENGVANTTVTMNSTSTPITSGTVTGQALSITADTTNGCLNVSYTPPTGNVATLDIAARIHGFELQ